MSPQFLYHTHECNDDNPKVIRRFYDWDGQRKEFDLCKKCCSDIDFSDFIREEKL